MKRSVQQKYFVGAQEIRSDGKLKLTLLEESKDTASCQALMRQPEFAQKYSEFVEMNLPFRVVIIREEPAVRIVREPSELAKELMASIKDQATLSAVLATLAKHGKDVGGKLVVREEGGQEAPGEAEEVSQVPPPPTPPPAPVLAAPKGYLDPAQKIPVGWEKFEQGTLVEIVKGIYPKADTNWTKAALTAAVSKYLESLNAPKPALPPMNQFSLGTPAVGLTPPILDVETKGLVAPPPPPAAPPEPPGSQAYLETEPLAEAPVDPAECPPDADASWVQEECPGCKCLVWRLATSELRKDPVEEYPEHTCPWYNGLKQKMMAPPPPPAAPPTNAPAPAAAPPLPPVAPVEGMVKPPTTSGQAPMFGRGFGVPPLPPKP